MHCPTRIKNAKQLLEYLLEIEDLEKVDVSSDYGCHMDKCLPILKHLRIDEGSSLLCRLLDIPMAFSPTKGPIEFNRKSRNTYVDVDSDFQICTSRAATVSFKDQINGS